MGELYSSADGLGIYGLTRLITMIYYLMSAGFNPA